MKIHPALPPPADILYLPWINPYLQHCPGKTIWPYLLIIHPLEKILLLQVMYTGGKDIIESCLSCWHIIFTAAHFGALNDAVFV